MYFTIGGITVVTVLKPLSTVAKDLYNFLFE